MVDVVGRVDPPLRDEDEERFGRGVGRSQAAEAGGFNVHAQVAIPAWDREGRERLCRYAARPAPSLARLSVTRDGRVVYAMGRPGRRGGGAGGGRAGG